MSEWKRVVSHVHVSGCMEPSCVLRRWFALESCHDGYVGRTTGAVGTFTATWTKLMACNTWTEWFSLTKEFEHSWHVMVNLKPPESPSVCDAPVERAKRPRDDSDPWNVAWSSKTHRRLEVLGDNKVVFNWTNGAREVEGDERGVVD